MQTRVLARTVTHAHARVINNNYDVLVKTKEIEVGLGNVRLGNTRRIMTAPATRIIIAQARISEPDT